MAPGRRHLDALDGVRGLAVAGVLAFHLDGLLPAGWLGVDAFFTLSGYLITSLLLAEVAGGGRIDLRAFWRRRIRRLQPAALVAVAVVVVSAGWWAAAGTAASVRGEAVSGLAGVANWHALWSERPYAAGGDPSAFEHLWSLAVEEQFYVVWPLVVAGVAVIARRRARATVGVVAGVAAVGSWALLNVFDLQRGYLGTDTRAGSILVGALLAAALPFDRSAPVTGMRELVVAATGVAATVAVGASWVLAGWPPNVDLGLLLPLHALAVALVLACVVLAPRRGMGRVLAWRPLTVLGKVSYGVYLWHWPVFVICTPERLGLGRPATDAVRLALTATLTAASWFVVESPIRRDRTLRRTAIAWPTAFALAFTASLVAVRVVEPAPTWATADGTLVVGAAPVTTSTVAATTMTTDTQAPAADTIAAAPPRHPTRVLVVGDSIPTSLLSGPDASGGEVYQFGDGRLLDQLGARGIASASATVTGCPVAPVVIEVDGLIRPWCNETVDRVLPQALDEFGPDLVVWFSRQEVHRFELGGDLADPVTDAAAATALRQRYEERLDGFRSRGVAVLLVSPGPDAPGGERIEEMQFLDRLLRDLARDRPDVVAGLVRMAELVCPAGPPCADTAADGTRFRPDDGQHYTGRGAQLAGEWLAARVATVTLPAPSR